MVPQVMEDEAGLFTEDRGGGLKQVNARGKAPHRDKRRKLAGEQGRGTTLS